MTLAVAEALNPNKPNQLRVRQALAVGQLVRSYISLI